MRERKNKKKGKDDEMCPIGTARSEKEKEYHNAYLAHKGAKKDTAARGRRILMGYALLIGITHKDRA